MPGIVSESAVGGINERGEVAGGFGTAFLWSNGTTTMLPGLGWPGSYGRAINNRGDVVGIAYKPTAFSAQPHAVLWRDGIAIDLGTPGAFQSRATAINDAGTIVGDLQVTNHGTQVFVWENGVMTNVSTLIGAPFSKAYGINARGQVLMIAALKGDSHILIWSPSAITDIGSSGSLSPIAINARGQVLGHSSLWDDGVEIPIAGIDGEASSGAPSVVARAFNDRGQVVGRALLPSGEQHAFLWTQEGGMIDLGTLNGDQSSEAVAINNRGEVIGVSGRGLTRAFLWKDGAMMELGGLPGATVTKAEAINERGDVAGYSNSENGPCAVLWRFRHDSDVGQQP